MRSIKYSFISRILTGANLVNFGSEPLKNRIPVCIPKWEGVYFEQLGFSIGGPHCGGPLTTLRITLSQSLRGQTLFPLPCSFCLGRVTNVWGPMLPFTGKEAASCQKVFPGFYHYFLEHLFSETLSYLYHLYQWMSSIFWFFFFSLKLLNIYSWTQVSVFLQ